MAIQIKSKDASVYVKNIWESLTEKYVNEQGKICFSTGKEALTQIITETGLALSQEDLSSEDTLEILKTIFEKALQFNDQSTKTAVAGLADIVKTIGRLEVEDSLAEKALEVGQAAYKILFQGTFRGWISRFKDAIAQELRSQKVLPAEYRNALIAAQSTAESDPSPTVIRSLALTLKNKAANAYKAPSAFKRFLEALLTWLECLLDVEKAFHSDLKIKGILKKAARNPEGIDINRVRKFSREGAILDTKHLIPHTTYVRIRIEEARLLGKEKRIIEAKKTLASIQENFSKAYRDQIAGITPQTAQDDIARICKDLQDESDRLRKPIDSTQALEILNRPRSKKSDRLRLNKTEEVFINTFLTWARANKEFNEQLVNKEPKTDVEECLCAFTWITLQQRDECKAETTKLEKLLETSKLTDFQNICRSVDEKGFIQKGCLDYYFCEGKKNNYEGSFVNAIKPFLKNKDEDAVQLQKLFKEMGFSQCLPKASQQFSEAHVKTVASMETKLKAMHSSDKYKKKTGCIDKALLEINTYKRLLDQCLTLRRELEKEALNAQPKISLEELHTIEQFATFHRLFDILPKNISMSTTTYKLYENAEKAEKIFSQLDFLMQLLPSYQPGDVIFDDEVMKKAFQGKRVDQVYSLKGKCLSLSGWVALFKEAATKGPFAVQPYFTGSRTHASLVAILPDEEGTPTLKKQEILSDFENSPISFLEGLESVAMRPNFEALLNEKGKELYAEYSKKHKEFSLNNLFATRLHTYMMEHQDEFHTYKNDCFKAAEAFIKKLSWLPRKIFEFAIQKLKAKEDLTPLEQEKLAKVNKVFCSEFVSIVLKNILRDVDRSLRNTLGSTTPLLNDLISMEPEKIDPNTLQNLLSQSEYYKEAPAPLVVRLLLGNDFGPKAAQALLKK